MCIFFLFGSCQDERACAQQGSQLQRNAGFDSKIVGARLQVPRGREEMDGTGCKMYLTGTRCDFTVGPMIFPSALDITSIYYPLCFFDSSCRQDKSVLHGSKKDSFSSPLKQQVVYSLSPKASVSLCWIHPGSS